MGPGSLKWLWARVGALGAFKISLDSTGGIGCALQGSGQQWGLLGVLKLLCTALGVGGGLTVVYMALDISGAPWQCFKWLE